MSESPGPNLCGRGAAALAAAQALAAPGAANAQRNENASPSPLYQQMGATRYSTPDGAVRFVFDRSGGRAALVQFDGDGEVHVLRPVLGAGGGEVYRTEDGALTLRVTPHGGIIVYTRAMATGAPAAEEGRVAPLTPEAVAFADMQARFRALQAQSRRRVGQTVLFTVPAQMSAPVAGVVLDAAERAAAGLAAAPMTNVRQVVITVGAAPRVTLDGDRLFIQVAPQLGYAGRPSSNTIRNVVSGQTQGPEQ